jgi:hypothetical protein
VVVPIRVFAAALTDRDTLSILKDEPVIADTAVNPFQHPAGGVGVLTFTGVDASRGAVNKS